MISIISAGNILLKGTHRIIKENPGPQALPTRKGSNIKTLVEKDENESRSWLYK